MKKETSDRTGGKAQTNLCGSSAPSLFSPEGGVGIISKNLLFSGLVGVDGVTVVVVVVVGDEDDRNEMPLLALPMTVEDGITQA